MNLGIIYIVATPIGNLQDITLRAIETLKSVDLILAEDTRQANKLLSHYGIKKPVKSFHEHNERNITDTILSQCLAGSNIALISDAGTPLLSDPGFYLVKKAKEAKIAVIPIPGPCALISALSASGLATDQFYFGGFVPPKSAQRQAFYERLCLREETLIFYESTHRIIKSLNDAALIFGEQRQATLAKEITKIHETIITDTLENIITWLSSNPAYQKGEFVLLIKGHSTKHVEEINTASIVVDALLLELSECMSIKDAAKVAAKLTKTKKNSLYDRLIWLRSNTP